MIEKFAGAEPKIDGSAWVHPSAVIIGRVELGKNVSVWPGAIIRGDVDDIKVGDDSNIQDLAVLHPNRNKPVVLASGVTVGHSAIIHGSTIGQHCLIGMGAIVMDSVVGDNTLVGAGAVVTPGSNIPAGTMVLGTPAKVVRALTEAEKTALVRSKNDYLELSAAHKGGK